MNLNYTIDFEFLYGIFILLIIVILKWKKIKSNTTIDKIILVTYYIYLITIISNVFFPIPLFLKNEHRSIPFSNFLDLVPFNYKITTFKIMIKDIGLFFPFGIYFPLTRTRRKKISFAKFLTVVFFASLTIEIIQLGISCFIGVPFNVFEVDAIIYNTVGAILGYYAFRIYLPVLTSIATKNRIKSNILNTSK